MTTLRKIVFGSKTVTKVTKKNRKIISLSKKRVSKYNNQIERGIRKGKMIYIFEIKLPTYEKLKVCKGAPGYNECYPGKFSRRVNPNTVECENKKLFGFYVGYLNDEEWGLKLKDIIAQKAEKRNNRMSKINSKHDMLMENWYRYIFQRYGIELSKKTSRRNGLFLEAARDTKNVNNDQANLTCLNKAKPVHLENTKKIVAFVEIPSRTTVLGDYDASKIADILREHLSLFRHCYQRELNRENKVSGKIELHFNIGASGSVTKVGVARSALPSNVEGCIINTLKGIKLPAPRGGGVVAVRQPMYFKPRYIKD